MIPGKKRYEVQLDHGFRKYFNTMLRRAKVDFADKEDMMGHKVALESSYERYEEADFERFAEYQKAIPFLTIDDSERKQVELDKIKKEKSNLKTANESLQKHKIRVDSLEQKVEDLIELVGQNNFSKIVYENIESNKRLLLQSLGKEHQIEKLNENKFIIGKKIPTEFRFQ